MNFNKVLFGGYLTKDPVIKTYGSEDKLLARCTLAINSGIKGKEEVLFIDVKCFGVLAKVMEDYIKKGDPVFVCGQLKKETWTNKTGNQQNRNVVIAQEIKLMGTKKSTNPPSREKINSNEIEEDDVPF